MTNKKSAPDHVSWMLITHAIPSAILHFSFSINFFYNTSHISMLDTVILKIIIKQYALYRL